MGRLDTEARPLRLLDDIRGLRDGVDQDHASEAVGGLAIQLLGDDAAHRVAANDGFLDAKVVEQRQHIAGVYRRRPDVADHRG